MENLELQLQSIFISMSTIKKLANSYSYKDKKVHRPFNGGFYREYYLIQSQLNVLQKTRQTYLKYKEQPTYKDYPSLFKETDIPMNWDLSELQLDENESLYQFNPSTALLIYADEKKEMASARILINPPLLDQEIERLIKEANSLLKKAKKQMSKHIADKNFFTIDKPDEERPDITCTRLIIDGDTIERPDLDNLEFTEIMKVLTQENNRLKNKLYIPPFYYHQIARAGDSEKPKQVKASIHFEKQRLGQAPDIIKQLTFDDYPLTEEEKQEIQDKNIKLIGIHPDLSNNKAIHAIQALLTKTDYKGTGGGILVSKSDQGNKYGFQGYLPRMKIKPSEFLEAYGVSKHITSRHREEFSGEGRRQAFEALKEMAEKLNMFQYRRTEFITNPKGKIEKQKETVIALRPLLSELNFIKNETTQQIEYIEFMPCFILVDQIDTYFVMKSANQYTEIQERYGKIDKYLPLFIDYLHITKTDLLSHKQSLNNIVIKLETLAYKLRLDWIIQNRQWKRLTKQITEYFEKAKELGYIKDFCIIKGLAPDGSKVEYSLNPDKFYIPEKQIKH